MQHDAIIPLLVVLAFSAVHLFGRRLTFLQTKPRSAWLSAAGGIAIAYVFMHLMPELARHQQTLDGVSFDSTLLRRLERHVYAIALLGLVVFYGLDRYARLSMAPGRSPASGTGAPPSAFWLHLGSFFFYNVLIGYLLLHREEGDPRGLALYAIALGLHFIVNDAALRESHGSIYDAYGRWVLAAAPLLGFGLGLDNRLSAPAVSALFAFLAGAIVLNALKEELPEARASRFGPFAAGAGLYGALLLATA